MKGSTERWVEVDGKEVTASIWRNEKEFYLWVAVEAGGISWNEHETCAAVEAVCFAKTQQPCKLYRVNRMQYVGYLLPAVQK